MYIPSQSFWETPQYNVIDRKSIKPVELITAPWPPDMVQCVSTQLAKLNPSQIHREVFLSMKACTVYIII